ncbi:MAG: hypothetical protein NT157_04445 [Candidatus Micrarchaeota archaeon]|nr:hypothetical protein [Candidatus Micrarchaeota archaeon]
MSNLKVAEFNKKVKDYAVSRQEKLKEDPVVRLVKRAWDSFEVKPAFYKGKTKEAMLKEIAQETVKYNGEILKLYTDVAEYKKSVSSRTKTDADRGKEAEFIVRGVKIDKMYVDKTRSIIDRYTTTSLGADIGAIYAGEAVGGVTAMGTDVAVFGMRGVVGNSLVGALRQVDPRLVAGAYTGAAAGGAYVLGLPLAALGVAAGVGAAVGIGAVIGIEACLDEKVESQVYKGLMKEGIINPRGTKTIKMDLERK